MSTAESTPLEQILSSSYDITEARWKSQVSNYARQELEQSVLKKFVPLRVAARFLAVSPTVIKEYVEIMPLAGEQWIRMEDLKYVIRKLCELSGSPPPPLEVTVEDRGLTTGVETVVLLDGLPIW